MKVECEISYADLCRQLQVKDIPGALNIDGDPLQPGDDVILEGVKVDEEDMLVHCSRCEECEDEPDYTPPPSRIISPTG